MYKYILFDLDGTLTDSQEGIINCFIYALKACGIEEKADNLKRVLGPPLSASFSEFYNMNSEQVEYAISKYRERFSTIGIFENEVYEGIPKALQHLIDKGYILAVATSKPQEYTNRILEKYELDRYFNVIVGSGMDGKSLNTKAKVIEKVLEELQVDNKADAIMVGDRSYDILGAKACNIKSIGVKYGYSIDDELEAAGADYIIDTVEGIVDFFENKQ